MAITFSAGAFHKDLCSVPVEWRHRREEPDDHLHVHASDDIDEQKCPQVNESCYPVAGVSVRSLAYSAFHFSQRQESIPVVLGILVNTAHAQRNNG